MPSEAETYDMTEEELRLFHVKEKQRQEAKKYFRSFINNPHRPIESGVPFDPVLYRFNTIIIYSYEHFKPAGRNLIWLFGLLVVPTAAIYSCAHFLHESKEKKFRSGTVAYKDRFFKMVF